MAIRMSHPKHGVTHAVGAEVAWNIANGWKVDPEVKPAPVEEASQQNVARKTIGLPKGKI